MADLKKKFKVQLNSLSKIEELLQELYNEADKNIVEAQNQLNKLNASVNLNNEIADSKAKIAKAINDYIKTKDAAIGRKLEIAKLMTEIHKHNGNPGKINFEDSIPADWSGFSNTSDTTPDAPEKITDKYIFKT